MAHSFSVSETLLIICYIVCTVVSPPPNVVGSLACGAYRHDANGGNDAYSFSVPAPRTYSFSTCSPTIELPNMQNSLHLWSESTTDRYDMYCDSDTSNSNFGDVCTYCSAAGWPCCGDYWTVSLLPGNYWIEISGDGYYLYTNCHPTSDPTASPTPRPSLSPSRDPSLSPSQSPSEHPSSSPSEEPSYQPSIAPTRAPTEDISSSPSASPSKSPTEIESHVMTTEQDEQGDDEELVTTQQESSLPMEWLIAIAIIAGAVVLICIAMMIGCCYMYRIKLMAKQLDGQKMAPRQQDSNTVNIRVKSVNAQEPFGNAQDPEGPQPGADVGEAAGSLSSTTTGGANSGLWATPGRVFGTLGPTQQADTPYTAGMSMERQLMALQSMSDMDDGTAYTADANVTVPGGFNA